MKLEEAARKAIALDNRLAALDAERKMLIASKNEAIHDWLMANDYWMNDDQALDFMRKGLDGGKA